MKIKKKYVLALVAVTGFAFFYIHYGWIHNPWANDRLVWDEPNPELIGLTFNIPQSATYGHLPEYIPIPVRKYNVTNVIDFKDYKTIENIPPGQNYRIQSSDVFTIQKTYWIRINAWSKGFHSDEKYAIVTDVNNIKYIFNFQHFRFTNKPEYINFKKLQQHISPLNYENVKILDD